MRNRYFYGFMFLLCSFATAMVGQKVHFDIVSVTTEGAKTVDVEVKAKNYKNVSGFQFSMKFDTTVLEYDSPQMLLPELQMSPGVFGLAKKTKTITVSYTRGSGRPLAAVADGTTLFKIRFKVIGSRGTSSAVTFANEPTEMLIILGENDKDEIFTFTPGTVTVNGLDPDALTLTAPTLNVQEGESFCAPITVKNFTKVQQGGGAFLFDHKVIKYTGVKKFHSAFANADFTEHKFSNVTPGEILFVYVNESVTSEVSVPDGDTIFELCFDAIGAAGKSSKIDLASTDDTEFQWGGKDDKKIKSQEVDGQVNIISDPSKNIVIAVENKTIVKGKTECINVTANNLKGVKILEMGFRYDRTKLKFVEGKPSSLLGGMDIANPTGSDTVRVIWSDAHSVKTIPNGDAVLQLCFEGTGSCGSNTPITIESVNDDGIIVDGASGPLKPIEFKSGTIELVCEPKCEVVRVDKSCAGQKTGNVIVAIEENCQCVWTDADGKQLKSGSGSDCNLVGVGKGTYKLAVTCPGNQPGCNREVIVEEIAGVGLDGTISYDGCTALGSIALTTTATEDLQYSWSPAVNNNTNPTGLAVGTYTVSVTNSASNCVETKTFNIVTTDVTLKIDSVEVVDVKCAADKGGSITINTSGGCNALSYQWSPAVSTSKTATGLAVGTYKVTVTDQSSPATSVSRTIEVKATSNISINPTIEAANGNTGSIVLNTSGGVEPYTYKWIGADNLPNSASVSGLSPGEYRVTITDAEGCTFTSDVLIVANANGGNVVQATAKTLTQVACHDGATGVIGGDLQRGQVPVKVTVTGTTSREITLESLGSYKIENLKAGTYALKMVDKGGNELTLTSIQITQPEPLVITHDRSTDVKCDKNNSCNGSLKVDVKGGASPYKYEWNSEKIKDKAGENLCKGDYTLVVTDANGCQVIRMITIRDCDEQDNCYSASKVITPNGDGKNDVFTINCVQDNKNILTVYDRWGRQVYKKTNYDNTWNGKDASGADLLESAYMWVLELEFPSGQTRIEKGTVTLLRE